MKLRLSVAWMAAFAACAVCAWAQPPFRRLRVVALDKTGQAVTNLTESDLRVTDDGKPQPIVSLGFNDNRPAAPTPLGPHEYSNQTGFQRRTTIILFDLLNGTFADRNFVAGTIQRALERAEDPAGLFFYILTNKGTLYPVHAIPKMPLGAAPPEGNWTTQAKALIDDAIQHVFGLRPVDEQLEGNREIFSYHALRELGAAAAALPGAKSIVWTTLGFPLQVNGGGHCRDVMVDGIKAPCLDPYVDFTPVARHLAGELDNAGISLWTVDESESAATVMARDALSTFSGLTGGKGYARGQTPAAVAESFVAMRLNYTLAYRPAEKNWNGKFHKVKVTCARKDVQVVAEDGYMADPPTDQTDALVKAVAWSGSDIPEIALRATATRGNAANTVRLQARIGIPGLFIVPQADHFTGELAVVFVGLTGKDPIPLTKSKILTLNLSAAEWDAAKDGIAMGEELAVPESVRQVRVIVVDRWAGRVGSLTVPKIW